MPVSGEPPTVPRVGSATALGYGHHRANVAQRAVQALGATRAGAWTFARVLPPVDRLVHRLSKGRLTGPEVLAGLPVVMVTTTGRRSGRARTTPLIPVVVDDDLVLLGTNFGGPSTPAWAHNLEADPRAEVEFHERHASVLARAATDAERVAAWAAAGASYRGFTEYRRRVTDRTIRVVVLELLPT